MRMNIKKKVYIFLGTKYCVIDIKFLSALVSFVIIIILFSF